MLFQKMECFCVCVCERKIKCTVFSQCEIEFSGYFWLFLEFFGFVSVEILVFPMQTSSGKLVICYTKWDSVFSHSKRIYIFTVIPKIC